MNVAEIPLSVAGRSPQASAARLSMIALHCIKLSPILPLTLGCMYLMRICWFSTATGVRTSKCLTCATLSALVRYHL